MLESIYFLINNTATRNLDKELGEKELGARCRAVAGYIDGNEVPVLLKRKWSTNKERKLKQVQLVL